MFTARYNMTQLVYFEALDSIDSIDSIEAAIRREKQIKGWLRVKKLALIVEFNPTWRDLYAEICIPKTYQPGEEREPETFF